MPGFSVVLVVNAASGCNPAEKQVVGGLMDAKISQVIRI